jgi:hypothetical protein
MEGGQHWPTEQTFTAATKSLVIIEFVLEKTG